MVRVVRKKGHRAGPLDAAPAASPEESGDGGLQGEVVDSCLMLDIDEDRETAAMLMQHYLDGDAAVVNGERRFIVDMKNEMREGKMVSIYFLGK